MEQRSIGINLGFLERTLPLDKAAELAARAGFSYVDWTPPTRLDAWAQRMKEAMHIFRTYGLTVYQTHMPFNRYGSYGDLHALCMERCAEATEEMGARFLVAHGDEFDFGARKFTPEAALDYNHRLFLPFVERAERGGYKVAFETVFEDGGRRRYTSLAEELLTLIDSFRSQSAVCCWDFGHAHVAFGKNAPAVAETLGERIQCTHLHDNTGVDAHGFPFLGDIDWEAIMGTFARIGYGGILSVEYSHGKIPPHLAEDLLRLTGKAASHLFTMMH